MKKSLLAAVLAFAGACVQASVGVAELPGLDGDGPVTVFYPTSSAERPLQRGPFALNFAEQGQPVRGNGRLVVFSHGSGGAPWVHSDLARAFVDAGFVVAMPEHRGDNYKDRSAIGPRSWKMRPAEVSRAIDDIAQDPRFAPLLSLDKVGMYGMSAGGHTALAMAGGRWSPSVLREHCEGHLDDDFQTCVGPFTRLRGDAFDGLKKAIALPLIRWRLDDKTWYSHEDKRIAAVVADVPFAADFDVQSLAHPRVPLGVVISERDVWLQPRYHVRGVLKACASCEVVADLPGAGHGSLLSPQPDGVSGVVGELLADPPGFQRSSVPAAHALIVGFFRKHLLP